MYIKKFYDSFSKIMKKYNILEKNIIFIRDCPRLTIWRLKYFKDYKANREDAYGKNAKQVFKGGPFFQYTYDTIIPDLMKSNSCKTIKSDFLEADDIIAITKKYLLRKNPDSKIIIVTSDSDLLQLIDDNTTLIL